VVSAAAVSSAREATGLSSVSSASAVISCAFDFHKLEDGASNTCLT
jgi:hypothetical protein